MATYVKIWDSEDALLTSSNPPFSPSDTLPGSGLSTFESLDGQNEQGSSAVHPADEEKYTIKCVCFFTDDDIITIFCYLAIH